MAKKTTLTEEQQQAGAADVQAAIEQALRQKTREAVGEARKQVAADIFNAIEEQQQDVNEQLIPGKNLSPEQHKKVLNTFVHRYTGEHKPNWASVQKLPDGSAYKPTHKTDKDWIHAHAFHVNKKTGELSKRHKYAQPHYMGEETEGTRHELFYGSGGHGGPYPSHEAAAKRAADMLKGSKSETQIHIKPYSKEGVGGYGDPVGKVYKDKEGAIVHHHMKNGTWKTMNEAEISELAFAPKEKPYTQNNLSRLNVKADRMLKSTAKMGMKKQKQKA